MTMQRKIILSDRVDLMRALPALEKAANLRQMKASMLSMAGANQKGTPFWFVVQTAERREKSVEERLAKENIRCFLPLIDGGKAVRRHRVVKLLDRPALPGYLLVNLVPSAAAFCGLRRVDGVTGIVGGLENPHRVADEDLNRFKIKLGTWDAKAVHAEAFHVGDWVRFDEGPFIGFSGRIGKIHTAYAVRGMPKIAIAGTVELTIGEQRHVIKAPLALLVKL
ncbi:antitermination protein [Rhizobium herbae]|uniref:Antitermination protein n=1 Tax=Rhizobium herbae TaxID=508661 RepID=A0ABS7H6E9_9HYPH|nr:transcription termination/antitermination NusG family protein [Rhizobium herbae]MBW9062390.1 antitermination protein [Rhizobium herbae]